MTFSSLLSDTCVIQKRTVKRGKTDTESWKAQASIGCRVLKRERASAQGEKVQHATRIRTIFMLSIGAKIAIRDRIAHEDRVYEVIEIVQTRGVRLPHHLNAICDAVV